MERRTIALALLAASAAPCLAGDARPRGPAPRVDAFVPVEPREHERLHFFGRRGRHVVPGTVTINVPPYVCDRDRRTFRNRDRFVAHLHAAHGVRIEDVADSLLVVDGQVHFPVEGPAAAR